MHVDVKRKNADRLLTAVHRLNENGNSISVNKLTNVILGAKSIEQIVKLVYLIEVGKPESAEKKSKSVKSKLKSRKRWVTDI